MDTSSSVEARFARDLEKTLTPINENRSQNRELNRPAISEELFSFRLLAI